MQMKDVPTGSRILILSGTELRNKLQKGLEIPLWFTISAVSKILMKAYPPRHEQGFTLFFTGLSASGKSTLSNAIHTALLEDGRKSLTVLDGDEVRTILSSELGFSKEHRDLNIKRIGYVAKQISKNGGVAICAAIAPYNEVRAQIRKDIETIGGFVEIYVATPLEVCEKRDPKALYAKARQGIIKNFT